MIAPDRELTYRSPVPRMTQVELTEKQRRELRAADHAILEAKMKWAATVRRLGISACARTYGVTPSAMQARLKVIDRQAEANGSKDG